MNFTSYGLYVNDVMVGLNLRMIYVSQKKERRKLSEERVKTPLGKEKWFY
jgi:TfoX/Sxy family transcriptional regulator of competence genes